MEGSLGLFGRWLPDLNLIPIHVMDTGKATVGFIQAVKIRNSLSFKLSGCAEKSAGGWANYFSYGYPRGAWWETSRLNEAESSCLLRLAGSHKPEVRF